MIKAKMTLEEAKRVYMNNKCSLFVMAREDRLNYDLYRKSNISSMMERKWKKEMIDDQVKQFEKSGDADLFNSICELCECFNDRNTLCLLMGLIDKINIEDTKTALCIAETIMGRKILSERSGMIFWAYDLGMKKEVVMLCRKVLTLINIDSVEERYQARAKRDCETIEAIMDMCKVVL